MRFECTAARLVGRRGASVRVAAPRSARGCGRGAQCAFTASHERDHHRVARSRTLVMGSKAIWIGYTHSSTTTAASRRPLTSLNGARPDRPTSA